MSVEPVDVVRHSMEAWNRGDREGFVALAHPDVQWHPGSTSALSGSQDAYVGRDGLRRWWDEMHAAFDVLRNQIEEIRPVTADTVLVIGEGRGRGHAAGVPVQWRFAMLVELSDGQFIRGRSWFDVDEGVRAAEALAQSRDPS